MNKEKEQILKLMDELIGAQQEKLLKCGRSFIPTLTADDLLQPNDYPILETNPYFRYEEGVLEGLHTTRSALLALLREKEDFVTGINLVNEPASEPVPD